MVSQPGWSCNRTDSSGKALGRQVTNSTCAPLRLIICPIAGGNFELIISENDTVDGLRKAIANKLKVQKEKINLLYRERALKEGTLSDNKVADGGKIILLPNVESGLMLQKNEQGVMQALENLTESQVTDFLAGKSPLTLMMRLGDHMMFVELQLSTTQQNVRRTTVSSPIQPAVRPVPKAQPLPTPAIPRESRTCTTSPNAVPILDGSALARASRNLSQRLKELSHTSFSKQVVNSTAPPCQTQTCSMQSPRSSGAIIESMYHHGQGVFSGTFSGTLNPSLQDKDGRPRKDLHTIIHILNDLLGATPQYRNHLATSVLQHQSKTQTSPLPSPASPVSRSFSPVDQNVLSRENQATRGKMEQIRQMLEERRHRRRVKRDLCACPYSSWPYRHHQHGQTVQSSHQSKRSEATKDHVDLSSVGDGSSYMELNAEPVLA